MAGKKTINKEVTHHTPWGPRKRVSIDFREEKSMTEQHHKDSCDINSIMRKYRNTGVLPELIKANPQYGDFSHPTDFYDALAVVERAEAQFSALPADVRGRFENDPHKFLEFVSDASNADEMVELGLATTKATAAKGGASNEVSKVSKAARGRGDASTVEKGVGSDRASDSRGGSESE